MSIEIENPSTLSEAIDAAWNHVEQMRIAVAVGDRAKLESGISEASRLLSVAMQKLEDSPPTHQYVIFTETNNKDLRKGDEYRVLDEAGNTEWRKVTEGMRPPNLMRAQWDRFEFRRIIERA